MSKAGANILDCQAKECSYNRDGKCHTIGINVGGPEPLCDTFVNAGMKAGVLNSIAKVGACKVQTCTHNKSLECMVKGIRVILQENQAQCGSCQSLA
jgi:hypothetical protein